MSIFTKRKSTDTIVVHCAATPPTSDIGAKEIDRWHRDQGWAGIGYHYVIRRDGRVEKGRPEDTVGAHVSGHNHNTIGICLVGGVDAKGKAQDNFTTPQWAALAELIRELSAKYKTKDVKGHRDFPNVKKDCPSFDVRKWIDETGVFAEDKVVQLPPILRCVEVTNQYPTIYSIARAFGYSVDEVLKSNPLLDPTKLKVGQLIILPDV